MRIALFVIALFVAGCTDMPTSSTTSGIGPAAGAGPAGSQQAYFATYPGQLFQAFAALCNKPGQTLARASRNEVRCEGLPPVESAAAIILQFNGSVEDLPKIVTSFMGRPLNNGYLVTVDNYISVPQRTGGTQQIRIPDPELNREISQLLRSVGGRPL